MKIKYIHKVKNPNVKVGDEAEVGEPVGRRLIKGGYAVEVIKPPSLNVPALKVKFLREVFSPARQAGKPGQIKDIEVVSAKHLIEEGYAEEYKERTDDEVFNKNTDTRIARHKKRSRKRF